MGPAACVLSGSGQWKGCSGRTRTTKVNVSVSGRLAVGAKAYAGLDGVLLQVSLWLVHWHLLPRLHAFYVSVHPTFFSYEDSTK